MTGVEGGCYIFDPPRETKIGVTNCKFKELFLCFYSSGFYQTSSKSNSRGRRKNAVQVFCEWLSQTRYHMVQEWKNNYKQEWNV